MNNAFIRRVVTGIDKAGQHVITSDGAAPNSVVTDTIAVSEVLWANGPAIAVSDSPDALSATFALEPPPGGTSARIIRMPGIPDGADPESTWLRIAGDEADRPGMHATDTLDLMVVLEGSVVMGLEDGERIVGPGEFVVQRGTLHRWRPADGHGWTYFVAMIRPDRNADTNIAGITEATSGKQPIRRIVTGTPVIDGGAVDAVGSPTSITMTDIWHTGGALQSVTQGGDPEGPWALEPQPGGLWFRLVELTPAPPHKKGWHATASVDVDVVLKGRVVLELPDGVHTELGPGDVVIQRGTNHRWTALGEERFVMASLMIDASRSHESS